MSDLVTYSTKAQQVERYLREAIRNGTWISGQRLPTETELMSSLKVSRSTLREALNFLYKDGLITRKQGQGTFVSTEVKAGTIVMIVKSTEISGTMGYWARSTAEEAKRLIEGAGYRFVLMVAQGGTGEEQAASVNIFDGRAAGDIVGAIVSEAMDPLVRILEQVGIRFVTLGTMPVLTNGGYLVFWDVEELVKTSVRLLKEHGHHDFAVMRIDPGKNPVPGSWTEETMLRCLQRVCDFPAERMVSVPYTQDYELAYDVFKEWWSRPNRPNAMFFSDDVLFDVASRAMLELGIDVPRDLAVITEANVGRQFHFPAQLTRVGWDAADVMSATWGVLRSLLNGTPLPQRILGVPPSVLDDCSLDMKPGVMELV